MSAKITGRDYEILQHLLRYKIATREMFHRALFSKVSPNAVTKVVTRLTAQGWLKRHPFLVASCYFTLTDQAAKLFGIPEAAIEQALPPQQLVAEYAAAAYCCLGEKPRELLTAEEIQQDYPQLLFDKLDSNCYYRDSGFRPELVGQIAVDDSSAPPAFLESCRKDVAARAKRDAVRRWIHGGSYRLTILTATAEKASVLRSGLKKLQWPAGLRTEVVVIPNLINAVAYLEAAAMESADTQARLLPMSAAKPGGQRRSRAATPVKRRSVG
jgi:hypothetical protein